MMRARVYHIEDVFTRWEQMAPLAQIARVERYCTPRANIARVERSNQRSPTTPPVFRHVFVTPSLAIPPLFSKADIYRRACDGRYAA
jgi:hypothetical protein